MSEMVQIICIPKEKEKMSDKMVCPICGRLFDSSIYECLDNGNPACPECVAKERKAEEREKE